MRQQLHFTRQDLPERCWLRLRWLGSAVAVLSLSTSALADDLPPCGLYKYKAEIVDVYDGDTITADIDLGFHTWRRDERLRLYGIDAPEIRGVDADTKARGLAARDALRERVLGKEVIVCTIRDRKEKYGRYLAEVYIGTENINDWLVTEGHAVHRDY